MTNYVLVIIGGGLGAAARYFVSGAVYRWLPADLPYGNLVVNISACFVIGVLMSSLQERFLIDPSLRVFLTVGILGGYSTFSSFSYETIELLQDGEVLRGALNVFASLVGGLGATAVGLWVGKLL
jgi:CrcB protein